MQKHYSSKFICLKVLFIRIIQLKILQYFSFLFQIIAELLTVPEKVDCPERFDSSEAIQTPSTLDVPTKCSISTQVNIRPCYRSTGTATRQLSVCDKSSQCEIIMIDKENQTDFKTVPEPILCSTPKKTHVNYPMDSDSEESGSESEYSDHDEHDQTYYPSESDTGSDFSIEQEELDISSNENQKPDQENKFLIFESCLNQLFAFCILCGSASNLVTKKLLGSMLIVEGHCLSGHTWRWQSQPTHGTMAWGNYLGAAAILLSGLSPTVVTRMYSFLKIPFITARHFFNYQKYYFHPAIKNQWLSKQNDIISKLKGKKISVTGDARCDTPGHNAKYSSYTLLDIMSKKIVNFQLVQSNETKNSNAMELEGLKRCFTYLDSHNVGVKKLVSDRHVQIRKYMRVERSESEHRFDCWHISKGLKKKIFALGKTKGTEKAAEWSQSISNFLYWVAASSSEDSQIMVDKWLSISNHICNKHEQHPGPSFPSCLHGPIDPSAKTKWLRPGSTCYTKIHSIVTAKTLIKDISQLSFDRTSSLEAFHSVVLHFAPKNTHYWHEGMHSRLALSSMHYNENSERVQATTLSGEKRYGVHFRKQNKGKASISPILEDCTYSYVLELLSAIVDYRLEHTTFRDASEFYGRHRTEPPPPLTAMIQDKPTKKEAVAAHKSRFNINL